MRKHFIIFAVIAGVAAVVTGVSLFSIYEASQQVPPFYHEAVSRDPNEQHQARDEFVAQATALASDLHRSGSWQSLFTTEQINAWLALELVANFPDVLPDELHEPRIEIHDHEAVIACRWETHDVSTVLSLTLDAYLQEPNVLGLRIRRARAGALPLPLAQVLDTISHAARELHLRLEWRKVQGDPVALVTFPRSRQWHNESLELQAIELREGELFVSGVISPKQGPTPVLADATADPATKSVSEHRLGEGDSPILLPGHPKIGTVPADSQMGSKEETPSDQPVVGAATKDTVHK